MIHTDWMEHLRDINTASILLRFVLAVLCGGAIGIEREHKQRPAGFRTHILVCIGAVTAMLLGIYLSERGYQTDVSRIGAQVISGIGFLGAGTILITGKLHIRGLTTAAGLWASACIGLAIGAGFYEAAVIGSVLIIVVSSYLFRLGRGVVEKSKILYLYIELEELGDVGAFSRGLKNSGISVINIDIERSEKKGVTAVLCDLECPGSTSHNEAIELIQNIEGVKAVEEL